jgi:hypothetical protein
LQVRITDSDGSNAIILDRAKNVSISTVINSSDEGADFEIAKNDSKAEVLNPDTTGYTKFWEVWDTKTNTRKNFGPITSITENGPDWKVEGGGRSSLLLDFYKSKKTFYESIESIIDDLRYEDLAIQPRTSAWIHSQASPTSAKGIIEDQVFHDGVSVEHDETFYGLSRSTKELAIDGDNGRFRPGHIEPSVTYYTTDSYWTGTGPIDSLIVDLGDTHEVAKIKVLFPWWGGNHRRTNRSYDYSLAYAVDDEAPALVVSGLGTVGPFHIIDSFTDNRTVTMPDHQMEFYIGSDQDGIGPNLNTHYVVQGQPGPILARYIRTRIFDIHAWYGAFYDDDAAVDGYNYQCDPEYVNGDSPGINKVTGIMTGKTINDRAITNANDCNASIVELGIFKKIMDADVVKPLAKQRIDNNSPQITYAHTAQPEETYTSENAGITYRRFEPGSTFRRFAVSWSGANTSRNKFYKKDCSNCYPDGYNFAVLDQNNSMVFHTDNASGSTGIHKSAAYTKHLIMRGSTAATVTYCDAWPARLDQLSWGASYSYTRVTGDTAIVHFKGQSFVWYATVPTDETGATVQIEIRSRPDGGAWTGWSTLNAGLALASGINSENVFEITYESGYFQPDTVYEIKLTNLGGYCSVDSFEGFWEGSFTDYNEDSKRIRHSQPANMMQIYDKRFTGGSIYKWNKRSTVSMPFEGDRVIVTSAKGRNHGTLKVLIYKYTIAAAQYDPGLASHVMIPGGNADGSIDANLGLSKRATEIPSAVIFDSNDYPDLLPWDKYVIVVHLDELDTYSATLSDIQSSNFVYRCSNCSPPKGSITTNKWVYLDGFGVHESVGLSISFENESHLEILKSVAEAIQVEWAVGADGIRLEPRIGTDTDIVLREGQNTLVDYEVVNDVSQMASMLISTGADIDGLPLYTISEQKSTRDRLGRTVTRVQDFRSVADYFQLVGLSRTELKRRAYPEKRISVTHIADDLALNSGDSFLLYTRKMGNLRVRINRIEIQESSSSGRTYNLECVRWPQIT